MSYWFRVKSTYSKAKDIDTVDIMLKDYMKKTSLVAEPKEM